MRNKNCIILIKSIFKIKSSDLKNYLNLPTTVVNRRIIATSNFWSGTLAGKVVRYLKKLDSHGKSFNSSSPDVISFIFKYLE